MCIRFEFACSFLEFFPSSRTSGLGADCANNLRLALVDAVAIINEAGVIHDGDMPKVGVCRGSLTKRLDCQEKLDHWPDNAAGPWRLVFLKRKAVGRTVLERGVGMVTRPQDGSLLSTMC